MISMVHIRILQSVNLFILSSLEDIEYLGFWVEDGLIIWSAMFVVCETNVILIGSKWNGW